MSGLDDRPRVLHRQGRLRDEGDALGIRHGDPLGVLDRGDQPDPGRGLAHRALDLLVARVSDEQDLVSEAREPDGFEVDLGDERAGGVDDPQTALHRVGPHLRRDPVGGEHHRRSVGDFRELVDETHAAGLEVPDDVPVVDDLLSDVDRPVEAVQGEVHDLDRADHARAKAAGGGEEDPPDGEGDVFGNHGAGDDLIARPAR